MPQHTPTQHETSRTSQGIAPRRQSGEISRYRDPFSLMTDLHQQMDRLFADFGFGSLQPFFGRDFEGSLWQPQIEMHERDGKLVIDADLPGLSKDDVHCEIRDNILMLEGERKREHQEEGFSERSYGRFFRSIPLPEGVNGDSAKASFKNGVLEITLDAPKLADKKGKRIEIA